MLALHLEGNTAVTLDGPALHRQIVAHRLEVDLGVAALSERRPNWMFGGQTPPLQVFIDGYSL